MDIQESVAFYRARFAGMGLTERDLLTEVSETTFSIVFDGDPRGTIVVQGVNLGDANTNINLRYEDI